MEARTRPCTFCTSPPIRRRLGHPAGPSGAPATRGRLCRLHPPDPGPLREVHRSLQCRLRRRGHDPRRDPPRSPNSNPHTEGFIRSVGEECTARLLLFDRGHAGKILDGYARHFNRHRPHQERNNLSPASSTNTTEQKR
ncbi:integrase core domain-containing protein [Streptomyces sp. NBC_00147]|uniref:integrase core domain-containing protein n=1 Tax=unclassified Streptomyces TaxID=2593676 RepID=UPI00386BACAE